MTKLKIAIYLLLFLFSTVDVPASEFPYRSYSPVLMSSSEDVNCIYFGSNGVLWAGTNGGLKAYDGYSFKTYRSGIFTPGVLPNNTIRCITEDKDNGLWIGTTNGLVRMDKRTGAFHTFYLPREDQRTIYTLYTSRDGIVWIGTNGGLSYYNPRTARLNSFYEDKTYVVEANGARHIIGDYSVKAILEDSNGDLLVGTWNTGLMRLRRGTRIFLRYPRLNHLNSAYSLFLDSRHRLWVGSWGNGALRIDNPQDVRHPKIHPYHYGTGYFDIFYKFVEDKSTSSIWACTREGVCSLDMNKVDEDWTAYTEINNTPLDNCGDIAIDHTGNLWVCTQNKGIIQTVSRRSLFRQYNLTDKPVDMPVNYVWSLLTLDGNHFWLGLNPYGIALYDRTTGHTFYNKDIPGFSTLPPQVFTTSVTSIAERGNGDLWFASNSFGVIVYSHGHTYLINQSNAKNLWDTFVNSLCLSADGTMWVGTRSGLNAVKRDGRWKKIIFMDGKKNVSACGVRRITQASDGSLWLATDNMGIIHLFRDRHNRKVFRCYNPSKANCPVWEATSCFADHRGLLWAISSSSGLLLYDEKADCFVPQGKKMHIPDNTILAINGDKSGNLWLTTDEALLELVHPTAEGVKTVRTYTRDDGLENMLFSSNGTGSYANMMFFGNGTGFFGFTPSTSANGPKKSPYPLVVTDILIDDTPYSQADSALRARVSELTPSYSHEITIPSSVRKFSVNFSLLSYGNANKNLYAYKLEGYDDEWNFIDNAHTATFQNLSSGKYELMVKAKDGDGNFATLPYTITVRVLPPWYASWWACIIYILLAIVLVIALIYWYMERLRTQNKLRMGMLLTNITHELLTPMTVISATVHKLRAQSPQYSDEYQVIDNNIRRTTRMLRQMLEVRKSQEGQLRLRVSRQDISLFVKNEIEAIRPMAESREVWLKTELPKHAQAWFDKDKLDKILYNLISNAIKYNHEDGQVVIGLTVDKNSAVITVQDNGIGMSREQLRHLYTRFFDGDYRRMNINGTGLGLALVHELVKLHHGTIECRSREEHGTTFTVTLPIRKSAYSDEEIDKSAVSSAVDNDTIRQLAPIDEDARIKPQTVMLHSRAPKVLLVEDNDDLLELMRQTLSQYYLVLTAKNGKQAWNIVQKEKLDLVITDVMMPVMDGLELLHAIKSDKGFWQLPVMLLTAKGRDDEKKEGYEAGADAYVVKPFDFDELVARTDSLIENRRKMLEAIVSEDIREPEKKEHVSNPDEAFLNKAKECVMKHISDTDFDRETFANDMLISSSTLYNKIRALTGKTIVEFINDTRLDEAHRIKQQEPDITIAELSSRVGFNTPKYFSRLYRKKFKQGS